VSGETILVVDDDNSVRRVVQMQLSEAGYDVVLAGSGGEALRILLEHRPKLLITDLRMPDLDGLELLRRIRHNRDRGAGDAPWRI
jgi:two-component system NtrC family response regulator